jgi:mono/diheme cytochrome c family protein
MFRRMAIAVALALTLGHASAIGGQDMVLGRMVPARIDAPSTASATHARAHYVLQCAGCHGFDGSGTASAYVPDLRQLGRFLHLPGGREFIVSVPGVMGSGLDDRQVAEVINWILRGMAGDSLPAGTAPYTAEEIGRVRAKPLLDVFGARRQLVLQAAARGLALD